MSKKNSYIFSFVLVCAVLSLVGCKDNMGGTYPLSIKVTMDGNPLEGATVSLIQQTGEGHAAVGMTDAKGIAIIKSTEGWGGAFPGEYAVTIKKTEHSVSSTPVGKEEGTRDEADNIYAVSRELLPAKYASFSTSEMKVIHESKSGTFEFDISSNP